MMMRGHDHIDQDKCQDQRERQAGERFLHPFLFPAQLDGIVFIPAGLQVIDDPVGFRNDLVKVAFINVRGDHDASLLVDPLDLSGA